MPDDHLFAYYGWRVYEGARPFVDIWDNKPPGIWWANAAGFAICGDGRMREVLVSSGALLTTLLASVAIARMACGSYATVPAALLLSAVLTLLPFECGADRTETFVAAAEALAIALYLCGLHAILHTGACEIEPGGAQPGAAASPRTFAHSRTAFFCTFLGGFFATGAAWFKQVGIAAMVAIAVHLVLRIVLAQFARRYLQRRRAWWSALFFLLGGACCTALCVTALAVTGSLSAAWYAIVTHNRLYFTIGDATWTRLDRGVAAYLPHLRQLWPLAAVAACCIVVAVLYRVWPPSRRDASNDTRAGVPEVTGSAAGVFPSTLFLLACWLVCSLYLAFVAVGRQHYHLAPSLAPLALLVTCCLRSVMFDVAPRARTRQLRVVLQRPTAVLPILVLIWASGQLIAVNIQFASRIWDAKTAWWSLEWRTPPPYQKQGDAIRAITTPDEAIYVWGWSPGTYRFAYRENAARFATLEQTQHIAPHGEWMIDEVVLRLWQRPPAIFVIAAPDEEGLRIWRSGFHNWLMTHYHVYEDIEGMRLYKRIAQEG